MMVAGSSEALVPFYEAAWCYNLQPCNPDSNSAENLKSHSEGGFPSTQR
jgi:hypothetical protein